MSGQERMTTAEYRVKVGLTPAPKQSKFGNKKTPAADGVVMDSGREATRYKDLVLMQGTGQISELRRQVPFECMVNGISIGNWIADFTYTLRDGTKVTEDVKGMRQPLYRWKKKHVEAQFGIRILET